MNWDVPDALAEAAGLSPEDGIWAERTDDGVLLRSDALRRVYVEATGRCNLQCAMCPRAAWADASGHMADEDFARLLDGLPAPGAQPITLAFGGFGEPTLHPRFLEMVASARRAACRVEIITNGTTLTDELARDLVALGVAQVTVSIDGGDDAAFLEMRGTARGPILDALARLRAASRHGRSRLAVGVACVATRTTAASLPSLIETARRLSLDFVSISNLVPHTRALADEALFDIAVQISDMDPGLWRPRLTVGRLDASDATRPLLDAMIAQTSVLPPPALDGGRWRNRCRFARDGVAAVSWDGRVAPCLSLLYTHTEYFAGHEKLVRQYDIGRVQETPVRDLWRSPAFRSFRARVRAFDMSPCLACGGCPISDTNEGDCYGTPFPACSECLWAQGLVLCP